QMAIEGYIGGSRYGILVEPQHEATAIRIVRQLAGRERNRARVIQGDKARQDAERLTLPEDSVINVMRFNHRIAEYYLRASYGSVVRVTDAESLRQTRRGVTQDGMGSGNYALFRCDIDDSQLLFGAAARKRNLQAQQQQLEQLQIQQHALQQLCERIHQLIMQLQRIRPLDYVDRASALLEAQQQLREVEQQLASLDLSEYLDLEEELQRVQQRYHELDARKDSIGTELGGVRTNLDNIQLQVTRLADQGDSLLDARDRAESYLLDAAALVGGLDPQQHLAQLDEQLEQGGGEADYADARQRLGDSLSQLAVQLDSRLREYNQQAQPADNLLHDCAEELHSLGFFRHICGLNQQLDNLHNRLRNNVLLEKQEQL